MRQSASGDVLGVLSVGLRTQVRVGERPWLTIALRPTRRQGYSIWMASGYVLGVGFGASRSKRVPARPGAPGIFALLGEKCKGDVMGHIPSHDDRLTVICKISIGSKDFFLSPGFYGSSVHATRRGPVAR